MPAFTSTFMKESAQSVIAHDRRMARRCIEVNCTNCKVGKAPSFVAREPNLRKPLAPTTSRSSQLLNAERAVLRVLLRWHIRGRSQPSQRVAGRYFLP